MFNYYAKSELELMVGSDEKIIWKGKPNKRCFIKKSSTSVSGTIFFS